ncbi:MAG TPA: hypothetical protein VF113_02265 [Stellaceae bacterium]
MRTTVTQDAQRRIIVKVSDTGIGIPPADMHRILLPFEQGQQTTERAAGPSVSTQDGIAARRKARPLGVRRRHAGDLRLIFGGNTRSGTVSFQPRVFG